MSVRFPILCLALSLGACASYDGRGLLPGTATEAEVRQLMGTPALEMADADGARQWAYPRGPSGVHTYMVHIAPAGQLARIEQVLDEAHFALVVPGRSTQETVMRLLGPPRLTLEFSRLAQTAWDYRYRDAWGYTADFSVMFSRNGVVVSKFTQRVDGDGRHR